MVIIYSSMRILLLLLLTRLTQSLKLSKKIQGPKSYNDKIAIVGAGPAGIHMALLLKNRGFKNVEILEKSNRIGGKSWSISYRGAAHELGTCYLAPDYEDNIIPLIRKYLPENDLIILSSSSVWNDSETNSFSNYLVRHAVNYHGTSNITEAGLLLAQAIQKYISIHKSLFGDYQGEIMPEPASEIWAKINGTFSDFLKRNNIDVLEPVFTTIHTAQGYGQLDEVACLYGLMWNTPKMMQGMLARISSKPNEAGFYTLKSGFQTLWENIVKEEKLDVKLNIDIKFMYRSKLSGYTDIWLEYSQSNGYVDLHHYDFLMWSPDMSSSMKYWKNKEISDEQLYFTQLVPRYYTTGIVNSLGMKRGDFPINSFYHNIYQKQNGKLWALRDTYGENRGYSGQNYTQNILPNGDDNLRFQTSVTYQMSASELPDNDLRGQLNETLLRLGATEIEILYLKSWRYFPRYLPEDVEKGYIWRVIEMQGKYGMWYIGSSVCFESVKSVVEYNELLLRNMETPTDGGTASKASSTTRLSVFQSVFVIFIVYLTF